jgi:hypothetical protein
MRWGPSKYEFEGPHRGRSARVIRRHGLGTGRASGCDGPLDPAGAETPTCTVLPADPMCGAAASPAASRVAPPVSTPGLGPAPGHRPILRRLALRSGSAPDRAACRLSSSVVPLPEGCGRCGAAPDSALMPHSRLAARGSRSDEHPLGRVDASRESAAVTCGLTSPPRPFTVSAPLAATPYEVPGSATPAGLGFRPEDVALSRLSDAADAHATPPGASAPAVAAPPRFSRIAPKASAGFPGVGRFLFPFTGRAQEGGRRFLATCRPGSWT